MNEAGTINIQDAGDFDETAVVVPYHEKRVAVCVSQASGGDRKAVLDKQAAQSAQAAL